MRGVDGGAEYDSPAGELIDSQKVAAMVAEKVLDDLEITPVDPSYHKSKFAAINAARMTLELRSQIEPFDAIFIKVTGD